MAAAAVRTGSARAEICGGDPGRHSAGETVGRGAAACRAQPPNGASASPAISGGAISDVGSKGRGMTTDSANSSSWVLMGWTVAHLRAAA
jgi:hypothetical protein